MESDSIQMRLTEGTTVLVRPWQEEDENRLPASLREIAWPSGYLKFFAPTSPIFNEEQEELLHEFEEKNQQAWVALEPAQATQPVLALGRLIRLETNPEAGEIAVAVEKAYQRRGLGRVLTAMLYFMAQAENIRSLQVMVQCENQWIINWLERLGASARLFDDEIAELDWPVYSESKLLPPNDSSRQFQLVLDQIKAACCVKV